MHFEQRKICSHDYSLKGTEKMGIKYKKPPFDTAWLAEAVGAKCKVNDEIGAITTDSRECEPGALFIAIKGERFDGHDYCRACS